MSNLLKMIVKMSVMLAYYFVENKAIILLLFHSRDIGKIDLTRISANESSLSYTQT